MPLRIYNSLTREKQIFTPLDPPKVSMYSCGPTVYGEFHIGNARTFVTADIIRRWLIHSGYQVTYAQNITDVDDKIIRRAEEEGIMPEDVAKKYTQYFLEKLRDLGNLPADHHPKATAHVGPMIAMIKKLEEKGHAYASEDGSVWFDVGSFSDYGKLSRMPLDQMREGERVDEQQQKMKRSPMDFCLWKAAKAGEPSWKSPWGEGRPGWHIECSCMSIKTLGTETIDIHTGGVDLRFPHHENEIAQSEAATGKPFVRYWIHQGMLDIDGEKISKSLGNFVPLDQVLAEIDALTLRYFLISARYRDKLDLTDDNIHKCRSVTERMVAARRESKRLLRGATVKGHWENDPVYTSMWNEFKDGMDDDFNTPKALAVVSKAITNVNTQVWEAESDPQRLHELGKAALFLHDVREALGLSEALEPEDKAIPVETLNMLRKLAMSISVAPPSDGEALVEMLIHQRQEARRSKDFAKADRIRDQMAKAGVILEDKPGETLWKVK